MPAPVFSRIMPLFYFRRPLSSSALGYLPPAEFEANVAIDESLF
jgi:hypothetical protein